MKSSLIKPLLNSIKFCKSKSRQKKSGGDKKDNEISTKETNFTNTIKEYLNEINSIRMISEPSRKYKRPNSAYFYNTNHNISRKNSILKGKKQAKNSGKNYMPQELSYYLGRLLSNPKSCHSNKDRVSLNDVIDINCSKINYSGHNENKVMCVKQPLLSNSLTFTQPASHTIYQKTTENTNKIKAAMNEKQNIIDDLKEKIKKTKFLIRKFKGKSKENKGAKYKGKPLTISCENFNNKSNSGMFVQTESDKFCRINLKTTSRRPKTNSCEGKSSSKQNKYQKNNLSLNIDQINNRNNFNIRCQNSNTPSTINNLMDYKNEDNYKSKQNHLLKKSHLLAIENVNYNRISILNNTNNKLNNNITNYGNNVIRIKSNNSKSLSKEKHRTVINPIQFTNYNILKITGKICSGKM